MSDEFATVGNANSPLETLVCVCGNTCSDQGYVTTDHTGTIACYCASNAHVGAFGGMLVEYPAEGQTHTMCNECGRVYFDAEVERGNTVSVFRVDPASDHFNATMDAHYDSCG